MTPEQIEVAEQIMAYAVEKLRAVELQHQADPRLIFGELLSQLVAAEYKVQAGAKANEQLLELIGAVWDGDIPDRLDHAITLKHCAALNADAADWEEHLHAENIRREKAGKGTDA